MGIEQTNLGTIRNRGFQSHGGYPNSWMVYFTENSILKWMRTGVTPVLGNRQVYPLSMTNSFRIGSHGHKGLMMINMMIYLAMKW